ncbi:MAG: ComF family protein [Cellvibrionaceae bacterium]
MANLQLHSLFNPSEQSPYNPCQCLTCGAETTSTLCLSCERGLYRQGNYCPRCAETTPTENSICGACIETSSAINTTQVAFNYQFPVDQLINKFKHQRDLRCANALLQAAIPIFTQSTLPQALIPVPLHWRRQLFRGFNQADVIAKELGRILNIPVLPVCRRKESGKTQQGLSRKQRMQNLRSSFSLKNDHLLQDIDHVAIVDDVVTTGATGERIAQLLKRYGIKHVDIWALAKTLATNPLPQNESNSGTLESALKQENALLVCD